ncbi:hypothetical protein IV203_025493 [Nitzschia inconspicua]|uniref:Uncharacterized protein n=1 Tax=Nitzschia inconspicua TaxID=303405 RepID=A0A9K3PCC2_9STRA|nr:hypothetical protein IV203_028270 [Nitzschia inconspicua]KAG7362609.1 hypothetical protein IV203_025493 [Nitzschia inconspicua]
MVKSVLRDLVEDQRKTGRRPNWTLMMGPLMAALNSHKVRGRNATSAYENVFGMPLHEPILGQVSQLRECFTVRERLDLLPDPELEASLRADLIIDGEPEEVSKDYWEEGEGSDSGDSCGDDNEPWAADDDEPTQTVMATTVVSMDHKTSRAIWQTTMSPLRQSWQQLSRRMDNKTSRAT